MLYPAELRARSLDYSAFGGVCVLRRGAELSWLDCWNGAETGKCRERGKRLNAEGTETGAQRPRRLGARRLRGLWGRGTDLELQLLRA